MRRLWVILLAALGGAALLALLVASPLLGISTPYSAYNPGADGASGVASALYKRSVFVPALVADDAGATVDVASFAGRDPRSVGALLVLEPATPATPAETAWLARFLHAGGTVVLAASTPVGNTFLEGVAQTRFAEGQVVDFRFTRQPGFPLVEVASDDPLLRGVARLVLNHPGGLLPGPDAAVLAETSPDSFLDVDGSGFLSRREDVHPWPWLVRERVGEGQLVLLSDPNLLVNGMRPVADAALFRDNALALLSERGSVVIDEGHHGNLEGVSVLRAALHAVPLPLRVGFFGAALAATWLALGGAGARGLRWARGMVARVLSEPARPRPTREELRARVLERNPRWDAALVDEAVAQAEGPP
jgi:hypothetical protein